MIRRIVLVAMLLEVAACANCKKTFKNLDKCRAGGFEISDCKVGDGDPSLKMKKRCPKMLRRAKKCGGYRCESAGNGWNQVKWPDSPSESDSYGKRGWEVTGKPLAVNVAAGENIVFTIRMNPENADKNSDSFYLIQEVQSLDEEGRLLGRSRIRYNTIGAKGVSYMYISLSTAVEWECYMETWKGIGDEKWKGISDVLNLTDLTDYTVSMDLFGNYTAKGNGGLDASYSFAGNPKKDGCYMEEVLGAKQARIYFLFNKKGEQSIWDHIKIEWKAEVIIP